MTMMNSPPHPGEILKERYRCSLTGYAGVSVEMALKLAKVF